MEKSAFGARLRIAFQNANNAQIAAKLGLGPSTIVNYMAGRLPEMPVAMKIKEVTGCDLNWLLTGEERPAGLAPSERLDMPSIEEQFRQIVIDELRRHGVGEAEDDVGGEVGAIEHAERIVAPVIARIEPGRPAVDERDQIRRSLVSDSQIKEMERRTKPRKRKTG